MALTTKEVLALGEEVAALGQIVHDARQVESENGKRLSKHEKGKIALGAAKLALKLVIDVID